MILKRWSKGEFSDPERRGQRAVRPLYCVRRGFELRRDSPSRSGFDDVELQAAEMGNRMEAEAEGTEGKADLRVAMLHVVDDEQAISKKIWSTNRFEV